MLWLPTEEPLEDPLAASIARGPQAAALSANREETLGKPWTQLGQEAKS